MAKRNQRIVWERFVPMVEMTFFFSAFLLLWLRDYAWEGLALAAGVPLAIWLAAHVTPRALAPDRLLLALMNFLCGLGVLVLYDTNPAYALHQVRYYGVGLAAMIACMLAVRFIRRWGVLTAIMMPVSFALLALPVLFGRETYGAKNWIYVAGVSFQPSELVKLFLLLSMSYHMSRRRLMVWAPFAVGCLGLLMLQSDLGTALLYYGVTLLLCFASTGSVMLTGAGAAGGVGAAMLGYRLFAHVKRRVAIWRNPWADYDNTGYQIIQSLMAIASGGLWGVGLGLGSPKTIPVYHTDFIFSVICEQFGLIFGVCVLLIYVVLIWRGVNIAMAARHSFHALLAMGCTLMLGLQTFVIIGGVMKMIPLTGVTLPFVSYGGSSLVSCMGLMGLMQGVASLNEHALREDERIAVFDKEGEE